MNGRFWRKAVRRPMFNGKRFELPKARFGLKGRARRYPRVLSRRTRGDPRPTQCAQRRLRRIPLTPSSGNTTYPIPSFEVIAQEQDMNAPPNIDPVTAHPDSDVLHWLANGTRDERFIDNIFAELYRVEQGRVEIGGAYYETFPGMIAGDPRRTNPQLHPLAAKPARRSAAFGCPSAFGNSRSPATWPTPASNTPCWTISISSGPG